MADVKVVTPNNTSAAVLYFVPRVGEAMCSAKDTSASTQRRTAVRVQNGFSRGRLTLVITAMKSE
jgi:hypothetical protein